MLLLRFVTSKPKILNRRDVLSWHLYSHLLKTVDCVVHNMTTGKTNLIQANPAPPPAAGSCKYGRYRRGGKFRRACCCIVFLLMLNLLLLLHASHSVGAIAWFMLNGSVTFKEDAFLFVPGGAKTVYAPLHCQFIVGW